MTCLVGPGQITL